MKYIILITFLTLISCRTQKTGDQMGELATKIELNKTTYKQDEAIELTFTVSNLHDNTVSFLKWQTPLESRLTASCFAIIYNEEELTYNGIMIKRSESTKHDYVTLNSGESISKTIDIKNDYSIDKPGQYSIQFYGRLMNDLSDSNTLKFEIQ
ncbi:MAG: hypothetical protein HRT68_13595 [Flavobacteriaceae bacterium]|nr:hypothetical protein [Flavobacteriaceae bacterium]